MKERFLGRRKSIISFLLAIAMVVGVIPATFAAQVSDYVDPADKWLTTGNRANELDMNAVTTYETQFCHVCNKETTLLTYRVPEYTKSGTTALNRNVMYSDGTCIDGVSTGNVDDGTPGVDAYYTGSHWTKSVCQACGTINSIEGEGYYSYNKNVYALYPCDSRFYQEFDNTSYEPYSSTQHNTTLKRGQYCQFCKGTYARASEKKEAHNFVETVDGQTGNNRFYITEVCSDCGYETSEYITAKSVVSSYYGVADGEAHTLTVTDLSEQGVTTSIRYGNSADNCIRTSAPNYTQPGYYTVYYKINYNYGSQSMTENGVSYVWLIDENKNDGNGTIIVIPPVHEHDYHYLETVAPSCTNLGYDRFQCNGCGDLIKTNYTQATGHNYGAITLREANCKQGGLKLYLCSHCGSFFEEETAVTGHKYTAVKHNPTCRNVGYTEYSCNVCGDSYMNNIIPIVSHAYERITKKPTCTEKGYTTSTCTMCGLNYVSDYIEATGHEWDEGHTVTNSTCEAEGVTEFHCINCDERMMKSESATGHTPGNAATCTEPQTCEKCGAVLEMPTGHHYDSEIVEPTCTAMGYTVYTCRDCTDTYTGNYSDKADHDYNTALIAPTCTQHGFTIYSCKNCDDEYISDYTDKIPHAYKTDIINPTCIEMGYTIFTCESCGERHKGDYVNAEGHAAGEWIIDTEATIEHVGSKHIECERCGEILRTAEIPQLVDKDHSDEDGNAKVGNYSIILTDKAGQPVFDSEITIDGNDHVTIKLPRGRILDYADQTTITAFYTDTQEPAQNLHICILDKNNNAATGTTDNNGQLKVPNDKSSTGDDNGTIGGGQDDSEETYTYVVTVADRTNTVIPDCNIYIGESNNLVVDLPDGIKPTRENPVIVTVTDHNGNAQKDITVIAIGDADFMEKGITDIYGKITLPTASEGYTDKDGKVNVDNINVIVNDEISVISNAYVKHNEDNSISVTLPEDKTISYANRITVTVLDSIGNAMPDITVTVNDVAEMTYTANTDENGVIVVPPLSEDMTDSEGKAVVNGYNVLITDEQKPIENAFVVIADGKISVKLPDGVVISTDNRITATITDKDNAPVKSMSVTFTDSTENSAENLTDENGKATVLPVNIDYTDVNGYAQVIEGEKSYNVIVEDTKTKIENAYIEIKDGKISVTLPDGNLLDTANQTTVTVIGKNNIPVKDMSITVTDKSAKTATKSTDTNGKITVPVKTPTGGGGGSYRPSGGSSGGGSSWGGNNNTPVTVTKEHKAYIVGYTDGTFQPDGNMTRAEAAAIFARLIAENKAENINGTKTSFTDISKGEWYESYVSYLEKYGIIKGYSDNTFRPDSAVTRAEFVSMTVRYYGLFDKVNYPANTTKYSDINSKHWAVKDISFAKNIGWLNGYADGTFRPDNNITRAEVVTITNHATGRTADKEFINANVSILNKFTDLKNNSHWGYYGIMEAANTHKAASKSSTETWVKK